MITLLATAIITATVTAQDPLVGEINLMRQKYLSPPLTGNTQLYRAAKNKACDMYEKKYWSHSTPNKKDTGSFIWKTGYKYKIAAENIARNFNNDKSIVISWEKSPMHKKVMLDKRLKEVGVGRCGNIVVMYAGSR